MPAAVKCSRVKESHIGLVLTQNVTGTCHPKIIDLGPLHEVFLSALLPAFPKQIGVAFKYLNDLIVGTGAAEAALQRIARLRHPILVDHIVNIGVAAGNGPRHRSSRQASPFCHGKNILHLNPVTEPKPIVILVGGRKVKIAGNAMRPGVASRQDADMDWIRHGRINGAHATLELAAAAKIFFEIRHLPDRVHIFSDHRIHRKDK